jgi:hypothetical protein
MVVWQIIPITITVIFSTGRKAQNRKNITTCISTIATNGEKSIPPICGRIRLIGARIGSVIWNKISVKKLFCPGEIQDNIALRKIHTVRISQTTLSTTNINCPIFPRPVQGSGYRLPSTPVLQAPESSPGPSFRVLLL